MLVSTVLTIAVLLAVMILIAWLATRFKRTALFITLAMLAFFTTCQVISPRETPPFCTSVSPLVQNSDIHIYFTSFGFGFPQTLVVVVQEGCVANSQTQYVWNVGGAIFDVLWFVVMGMITYGLTRLYRRWRPSHKEMIQ